MRNEPIVERKYTFLRPQDRVILSTQSTPLTTSNEDRVGDLILRMETSTLNRASQKQKMNKEIYECFIKDKKAAAKKKKQDEIVNEKMHNCWTS